MVPGKWLGFLAGLFLVKLLAAQCPDRILVYRRILYLRDSSSVLPKDQLAELEPYLTALRHCTNPDDSIHALLLSRIGWLYSTQREFDKAVSYTRRSVQMIDANSGASFLNPAYQVKNYNNLRIFYDSLNEKSLESAAIDSCILLSVILKKGYNYSLPLISLRTNNLFETGDYYRCIYYADMGESVARESGFDLDNILYYVSWKVNALIFLKKYDEARALVTRSITECTEKGNKGYPGVLYNMLATICQQQDDVKNALTYSRKSFSFDLQVKNYADCAATLNNTGLNIYFLKFRQYGAALGYFRKALHYADNSEAMNILANIANVYVARNLYDSAFFFFQRAFDRVQPGADENYLSDHFTVITGNDNKVDYVVGLMLDKGDAYLLQYKYTRQTTPLQQAIAIYKKADILIGRIRMEQTETSSRLFWRTATRRLYENAIEACFLSGNMEDAFYFFEKSKAVLLNDQLRQQSQLGESDIFKLAAVKKRILRLEREYGAGDGASGKNQELRQHLFTEKQYLNRLEQSIKSRNPLYYQSVFDTSFIRLQQVKNELLKTYQAVVALFNGERGVYALTITPGETFLSRISKSDFDSTVYLYNRFLSDPGRMNGAYRNYVQTAFHLYQLIFQGQSLPEGRIIISPDGSYFPFESLVTSDANRGVRYFLATHAVSYAYSVRFLFNYLYSNPSPGEKNFVGIAPVDYPASLSLASLSGSDHSVDAITGYFGRADNLIRERATRNNFLGQFYKYKIIQLYTHAAASNDKEPVIYFSDSALYLSELIGENKPLTKLIVLSACETGLGTDYKGEGVFSFNRGFAALGIPSSVTNLWTIDNESTYKLTELFYKYVAAGLPLDEALQRAKLDFIKSSSKEQQLPYYWAASILVGNSDRIQLSPASEWPSYAAASGVLVILLLLLFFIKIRRRLIPVRDKAEIVS